MLGSWIGAVKVLTTFLKSHSNPIGDEENGLEALTRHH
jgi:hypothetical protein